jgi:predicted NodU family carbamoyl transferase
MITVGINYTKMHASSACIVRDGDLLFAVAEGRISRVKHDARFPHLAIKACANPFRQRFGEVKGRMRFVDHHLARAISAYAYSGFEDSAVVVMDGRGAWEATSIWHGRVLLANFRRFTNISEETSSRHLQALPQ